MMIFNFVAVAVTEVLHTQAHAMGGAGGGWEAGAPASCEVLHTQAHAMGE